MCEHIPRKPARKLRESLREHRANTARKLRESCAKTCAKTCAKSSAKARAKTRAKTCAKTCAKRCANTCGKTRAKPCANSCANTTRKQREHVHVFIFSLLADARKLRENYAKNCSQKPFPRHGNTISHCLCCFQAGIRGARVLRSCLMRALNCSVSPRARLLRARISQVSTYEANTSWSITNLWPKGLLHSNS